MAHHFLKTWPKHFDAVARLEKTFEVRKNDRDFKVGDTLTLQRYDPKHKRFTGAEMDFEVPHILHGGQFGIEEGAAILSLRPIGDWNLVAVNPPKGEKVYCQVRRFDSSSGGWIEGSDGWWDDWFVFEDWTHWREVIKSV